MALVLITGSAGQLGLELQRAPLPDGWRLAAPARDALDLSDVDAIARAIAALKPALIINAAAYTAVDRAEAEPEAAFALNREAPAALARAASSLGAPLVHVSTDYVFAGDGARAYREDDAKAPLGVYGRSKSEGEDLVLAAQPHAAILRTSWVFSAHRANFVKTMLRLGETRQEVGVVADQFGRPTAAADLAGACIALGEKLLARAPDAAGIFHYANQGDASWADFAEAVFAGAEKRGRAPVQVNRIGTEDYPTPAKRPANSRLDTSKIEAIGITPRPWREALDECLDELLV
ncbi:MAG TPA: dTDP-4-dehydrorhamnose reductase [Terricaulis sp.]|nr:dTDP-4-dehydrorhamnose reductase [Terricaulis sp.]